MKQRLSKRRLGWMCLIVLGGLGWWFVNQGTLASAQSDPPKILVTWVAESNGQEGIFYSILDDEGNTLFENKVGLVGDSDEVNFRICGVHWTGRRWIVIVDDGEIRSERGILKVVISPDGTSGWFGISQTFDFVSDVTTHQVDGNTNSGGCLSP